MRCGEVMKGFCVLALPLVGCVATQELPPFWEPAADAKFTGGSKDLATVSDMTAVLKLDLPQFPLGLAIDLASPCPSGLLTGSSLLATAIVKPQSGDMFTGQLVKSTTLFVSGNNGSPIFSASMSHTDADNQYQGSIALADLPPGPTWVWVQATDLGDNTNSTKPVLCHHDLGPVFTVVSPKTKPKTYKGSAALLFTVTDPVGVKANSVKAMVQSVPIPVEQNQNDKSLFTGTIKFHDFSPVLSGDQVLVLSATNTKNTSASVEVVFTVDEAGPKLKFLEPAAGTFIGGILTIKADVSDTPSGVESKTVVAVVPDVDKNKLVILHTVPLQPQGLVSSTVFTGTFDTRQLNPAFLFPNISIRAQDTLGNESEIAEQVIVDNSPPALDLDPPLTTVVRKMDPSTCANLFDPVGEETASDGEVVNQIVWLKARAEDRGNVATGNAVEFVSRVASGSVELFVMPHDPAAPVPLIVDSDGDGYCDDINPELVPSIQVKGPKEALTLAMAQVPSGGGPDFTTSSAPLPPSCGKWGEGIMAGMSLCPPTWLKYIYSYLPGISSIYSIPPISSGNQCLGMQLDTLNKLPEGPVCAAVRGYDVAGNRNVSRPIRLCIQRGNYTCSSEYVAHPNGPKKNAVLPDCTGTYSNGKVSNTACIPGVKLNTGQVVNPFADPYSLFFSPMTI